ncbi:glycosyltransferase [Candidatus Gracilibacteria bacterium]|nr:glycosyltransferase [Candidatus Gracilibacteria bacterium]
MSKTLVLHDTFLYKGGGERLVLMIANVLEADIASGFFSEGSYNLREQGFKGAMITLMPRFFLHEFTWMPRKMAFIFKNGLRHFGLKWAFSINARKLKDKYDTIVLSGDCLSSRRHFEGKKVLYYCHTIPRYLFDQREQYEQKVPKIILYPYRIMTAVFRKSYLRDLSKIDHLLTNSINTQKRIKAFTHRDAEILYPPVDTEFFCPADTEQEKGYFLSFARLSSIKRVDRIVSTFQDMSEERLIVTYGKNDPEKQNIIKMVEGYENIEMRESPSDIELRELIRGAKATIYIPVDEDFGMSPVESMACGTPVIGVNDGGLRESIIDGETGILINPLCETINIREAVKKITSLNNLSLACLNRAAEFSLISFQQKLNSLLTKEH